MTYPKFLSPKTSAQEDIAFFFEIASAHTQCLDCISEIAFFILTTFALAEIIKKKMCIGQGFSQLFKKERKKKSLA